MDDETGPIIVEVSVLWGLRFGEAIIVVIDIATAKPSYFHCISYTHPSFIVYVVSTIPFFSPHLI